MQSEYSIVSSAVLQQLEELTGLAQSTIRTSDRIVEDLKADSDDLSFLFVPSLERQLGIRTNPEAWRSVHTVGEAIDFLMRARQPGDSK